MNTLTLKIPQSLDDALQASSAKRQMSKSAVVREALEKTLAEELKQASPAAGWVNRWRGIMISSNSVKVKDDRVAHILDKHLR
jgi:predicted transcriptional regulator